MNASDAQTVDIAGKNRLPPHLLRCGISRGADNRTRFSQSRFRHQLGGTKVYQNQRTLSRRGIFANFLAANHILRLEVPVNDLAAMDELQHRQQIEQELPAPWLRSTRLLPAAPEID